MSFAKVAIILFCMVGASLTGALGEERVWRGGNGKSFRGTFHRLSPDGSKAEFVMDSGKIVSVALDNLIQEDRDLVLKSGGKQETRNSDAAAFKPDAEPDRTRMPVLDPKQFDRASDEEMVDALWISLLWWNQEGVLPVPAKGEFEKRAEWLHKTLTRHVAAAGRSAASLEDARNGVLEYFKEELAEVAACRIHVEQTDLSPARLASLARGANVVILKLTMTYDNGRDFSACAALESINETGRFAIHLLGRRLTGRVKALEKKKDGDHPVAPLEFVLDDNSELPEFYRRNGAVFTMGLPDKSWNGVLVVKPYVYAVPGKPAALPAANEFASDKKASPAAALVTGGATIQPKFPINFSTSVVVSRIWNLVGGRKFEGAPAARPGQLPVLRNHKGQQVEVTPEDFMPEDRAIFELWLATTGAPQAPPRMELTYRLDTPKRGAVELRVAVEGMTGRLEVPGDQSVLVFDMKDGAFASTRAGESDGKPWKSVLIGRFDQEHLLGRRIHHGYGQEDLDRMVETALPGSRQSSNTMLPARFMRYPLPSLVSTFRDPEIEFVLMENPVVLAALSQFLCMHTAGDGSDRSFVFFTGNVPWNMGVDHVFPILAACHVTPVGLKWTNMDSGANQSVETREKSVGKFALMLIRASSPDAFPEGYFDIPEQARTMAVGTDLRQ